MTGNKLSQNLKKELNYNLGERLQINDLPNNFWKKV